jgi:hypothetical protein
VVGGSIPVVEQVLDGDLRAVLEHTMVHDPITALADHVLIGEHPGSRLQLLERVPVAPPEMGHLRHRRWRVVRSATSPTPSLVAAVRRRPVAPLAGVVLLLRVRDAVLLAGRDLLGDLWRGELEHLRERRLRRGGSGGGVRGDFLDVLGRLDIRGVLGRGGGGELLGGVGRPLPAAAAAEGEEAEDGDEDEQEHEGGADADADEHPHAEPEHHRAPGQLRVRHGTRRGARSQGTAPPTASCELPDFLVFLSVIKRRRLGSDAQTASRSDFLDRNGRKYGGF